MQVTGLFHVAIKTPDLDATVKFYTQVLGMELAHRPDFGFPGAWIAQPNGPLRPPLRRRLGSRPRRRGCRPAPGSRPCQPDGDRLGRVP